MAHIVQATFQGYSVKWNSLHFDYNYTIYFIENYNIREFMMAS